MALNWHLRQVQGHFSLRKRRDLNPRGFLHLLAFKASAFGRSATLPRRRAYNDVQPARAGPCDGPLNLPRPEFLPADLRSLDLVHDPGLRPLAHLVENVAYRSQLPHRQRVNHEFPHISHVVRRGQL